MKTSAKNFVLKAFLLSLISFSAMAGVAPGENPYYGASFFSEVRAGLSNKALIQKLNFILKSKHTFSPGNYDTIDTKCTSNSCYERIVLGYNGARKYLLGEFYLLKMKTGYGVRDLYCQKDVPPEDFRSGDVPGPGSIPDGNVVNTEHTWPQSRFSHEYSGEMQKSDLHHLFPTDNQMNSVRGNFPFGEVEHDLKKLKCDTVRFGVSNLGEQAVFEPPQVHKGNVARALFYFSTRYNLPIDPHQEATLRIWHKEDPADEEEVRLNNRIFEVQHDRNPFIDYPSLVDRISDF